MSSSGKQLFKLSVPVDVRHRAFLIGHKGKRINKLREECNNVLIIIPKPDKPSEAVEIAGAEKDVKKAASKIKAVCKAVSDSEVTTTVPLPDETQDDLLAPESALFQQLCHEYCCRVEVSKSRDAVQLAGTSENVAKAKAAIDYALGGVNTSSLEEAPSQPTTSEPQDCSVETFSICKQLTVALYGYNRKLLRFISSECEHIKISINATNEVSLSGSVDGIAYAKDQLQKLNEDLDSITSVQTIAVKAPCHKFLLSSYGVHSKLQRQKLGVRIILPDSTDTNRDLIYIFGRKKDAQDVKKLVEDVAVKLSKHYRQSIPVPAEYTNRFTEMRGKVLKQVTTDIGCGVHLHLEGGQSAEHLSLRNIVFSGPTVCFRAAEEKISDLVGQYDSFRTQVCKVPFELFDSVKGPNDAYIQQLMEDYDVKIVFPPPQPLRRKRRLMDHVGDVKVSGQVGDVERACDELMAAVPVCREVRVPLEYYSFFAGHKSSYLDQLKEEFQVVIKVKPAEELYGIIVVIGPEDDVISCCQYIEQQVGLLAQEQNHREKLRFSMTIDVDIQYQKKLIGKKGSRLRQICSKFHIDITMPPKGDDTSTTVLLQGYEERCRNAAAEIERILEDMEDRTTALVDTIPGEFHRKLIGHQGRNIRSISDKFRVDIKVPKSNTDGPITITGRSQGVKKCAEHIQSLAEQHEKAAEEDQDTKELMKLYMYKKPAPSISDIFELDSPKTEPGLKRKESPSTSSSSSSSTSNGSGSSKTVGVRIDGGSSGSGTSGFVVSDAPWSPKACGEASTNDKNSPTTPTWPHRQGETSRA